MTNFLSPSLFDGHTLDIKNIHQNFKRELKWTFEKVDGEDNGMYAKHLEEGYITGFDSTDKTKGTKIHTSEEKDDALRFFIKPLKENHYGIFYKNKDDSLYYLQVNFPEYHVHAKPSSGVNLNLDGGAWDFEWINESVLKEYFDQTLTFENQGVLNGDLTVTIKATPTNGEYPANTVELNEDGQIYYVHKNGVLKDAIYTFEIKTKGSDFQGQLLTHKGGKIVPSTWFQKYSQWRLKSE